jgi:hypothetical protein
MDVQLLPRVRASMAEALEFPRQGKRCDFLGETDYEHFYAVIIA